MTDATASGAGVALLVTVVALPDVTTSVSPPDVASTAPLAAVTLVPSLPTSICTTDPARTTAASDPERTSYRAPGLRRCAI